MRNSLYIGLLSFFAFAIMDATNKLFFSSPTLSFITYFTYTKILSLIFICLLGFSMTKKFLYVINIKWTIIKTILLTITSFTTALSIKYLPLSAFSVFVSLIPILTSVLSAIVFKDKFTKYHALCLILCFIGVVIICSPSVNNNDYLLGIFFATFTIVGASSAAIIIRKYLPGENATGSTFYTLFSASIFSILFSLLDHNNHNQLFAIPDSYAISCIVVSAITMIMARVLYMKAFQLSNPINVAYLQYTHVLWSFLFGVLFFHEVFTILIIIGYLLIISSSLCMLKLNSYYANTTL